VRGNIYITGDFWDTLTFGVGEANEVELTDGVADDSVSEIFVAKYRQGRGQRK
jgi:hypothetical protein